VPLCAWGVPSSVEIKEIAVSQLQLLRANKGDTNPGVRALKSRAALAEDGWRAAAAGTPDLNY